MEKEYLGDGAYVAFDGFGFWLTAEDGLSVQQRIYLEPEVLAALERFVERIKRRSAPARGPGYGSVGEPIE